MHRWRPAIPRTVLMIPLGVLLVVLWSSLAWAQTTYNVMPEPITLPYDVVYVRSPRTLTPCTAPSGICPARWAEFGHPYAVNPRTDLMLLHPDGSEEVLVAGGVGAVQDPYVSFDGETVFYTLFHQANGLSNAAGADIYKIHVPTRTITRLTQQVWHHPRGFVPPWGVYNIHPCPLPGGKVAFVSNRNGYLPPSKSYPEQALQLHVMSDDGSNIETIGHLNLGSALHPTILKDGRIVFSSLENMGNRRSLLWGLWSIWPDGTAWNPVVSAFLFGGAPSGVHFQTQLSDGRLLWELYYNQNQKGFGTFFAQPAQTGFGPGDITDPRNPVFFFGGTATQYFRQPFTPQGLQLLTPWASGLDFPAYLSLPGDKTSPHIGKVTHPSGALENHLLLVWSLGPIGGSAGAVTAEMGPQPIDSGLYLLLNGAQTTAPRDLRLIKNDPAYNEQWPRALVPYQQIYGVPEPAILRMTPTPQLLPATPFGLIGTSSLYKRESAPLGKLQDVTGVSVHLPGDPARAQWNWTNQGSDAGNYTNEDIEYLRLIFFEPNVTGPRLHPTGDPQKFSYPQYTSKIMERLRFHDVPVRKTEDVLDPDGNPDTSFLAKVPADVSFTFALLDAKKQVLTFAQTWHQVRPGEVRTDCGGCHAHSQTPTQFSETAAGQPDFVLYDATTPARQVSYKDIQPLWARCTGCHNGTTLAGNLRLDEDGVLVAGASKTYATLGAKKYLTALQSRRSPLMWRLYGARLDGLPDTPTDPSDNKWIPGTVDHTGMLTDAEKETVSAVIDTGWTVEVGAGGLQDDQRPTLVVHEPGPGLHTAALTQVLVGMFDQTSHLDMASFNVTADVMLGGVAAGTNLAPMFQQLPDWRWQWTLSQPVTSLARATLTVQVQDTAGNRTQLVRTFRVEAPVTHAEGQWPVDGGRAACQVDAVGADQVLARLAACGGN